MTSKEALAFHRVCRKAKPADYYYVSLYAYHSVYLGPEEGGCWGQDVELISSQEYFCKRDAVRALNKCRRLIKKLDKDARDNHGNYCNRQLEWLEARGLEADYLRENDGPTTYGCIIEKVRGSAIHVCSREYA
jgi:hypothetical protein